MTIRNDAWEPKEMVAARAAVDDILARGVSNEAAGVLTLSHAGLFEGILTIEVKGRARLREALELVADDAYRNDDRRKKAAMAKRARWRVVDAALEPHRGRLDRGFSRRK